MLRSRQVRQKTGYISLLIGVIAYFVTLNVANKGKYEESCECAGLAEMSAHLFRAL